MTCFIIISWNLDFELSRGLRIALGLSTFIIDVIYIFTNTTCETSCQNIIDVNKIISLLLASSMANNIIIAQYHNISYRRAYEGRYSNITIVFFFLIIIIYYDVIIVHHTCSTRLVDCCRTCWLYTRDGTCVRFFFSTPNEQTSEKNNINRRICKTLIRFPTQRTRNILTSRAVHIIIIIII